MIFGAFRVNFILASRINWRA